MECRHITNIGTDKGEVHTISVGGVELWHKRHHLEIDPSFLWVSPELSVDNLVFCDINWKLE